MSRRRRNRMVTPVGIQPAGVPDLEIPEDDLDPIEEREDEPESTVTEVTHRQRPTTYINLAAARSLRPVDGHWPAMWEAGRDAAITAVSKGVSVEDAATIKPPDTAQCADCWTKGRDAVVSLLVRGF